MNKYRNQFFYPGSLRHLLATLFENMLKFIDIRTFISAIRCEFLTLVSEMRLSNDNTQDTSLHTNGTGPHIGVRSAVVQRKGPSKYKKYSKFCFNLLKYNI